MKVNKTYKLLLDKSVSCMLSAIEIYNKPNFGYREDVFAILCVNSWELLLKAILLRENKYKMNSVYVMIPKKKKDGSSSKLLEPSLNRCGNPKTITLPDVIKRLKEKGFIPNELEQNLEALMELRDNAIHFANMSSISKTIQELGFAAIKNYMSFVKNNDIEIDLTKYNFYLMPLAYVDSKVDAEAVLTDKEHNYISLIKKQIAEGDDAGEYDIVISIDIGFKKGTSLDSLGIKYDPDGIPISLTEENLRRQFPLSYDDVCVKCREIYFDFKQNNVFHSIMKGIKANDKLCHVRKLDMDNPKSAKKPLFSSNVFKELDKHYTRKKKH